MPKLLPRLTHPTNATDKQNMVLVGRRRGINVIGFMPKLLPRLAHPTNATDKQNMVLVGYDAE